MAETAVVNGKAKAGGKRKTLAEKMAEESAKIVGDLKASSERQTRNAAKGIVYQPPEKKAKNPSEKLGRPKSKAPESAAPAAAEEEAPAPAAKGKKGSKRGKDKEEAAPADKDVQEEKPANGDAAAADE